MERLVILSDVKNNYYFSQVLSLMKGFHQVGVDCQLLDVTTESLAERLEELQPSIVFEINKTRNQWMGKIPREAVHIAWVQDAWFFDEAKKGKSLHRNDANFGGSELVYFLLHPRYFALEERLDSFMAWGELFAGVDEDVFSLQGQDAVVDGKASLCGYIPSPVSKWQSIWNETIVSGQNGRNVSVGYLIERLTEYHKVSISKHTTDDIHRIILNEVCQVLDRQVALEELMAIFGDHWLLLLLDTELPRIPDRYQLAKAALNNGLDLDVYGPPQWLHWPEFKDSYRKNVSWPGQLAAIYGQSQFNLHNGAFGMHSRVLESMAVGGAVFVNHSDHARGGDIHQHFSAGEDFILYETGSIGDTIASWKGKRQKLREVGVAAAEKISGAHLWRHRAQQIMDDVTQLKCAISALD
ncbi:glycosyltransferase [Chromobacterium haemolyticum]|uniref:glycosyltransferase family protein n=1 Tax=Chromobacterium haemolyticum TaxID=394935 RepID=UPI000DEFCBCE|nr:glycosyltransferase [Chromobacterium haemolyticum]